MRNIQKLCTICLMVETLCYDLARAEKAKDGKKDAISVTFRFDLCICWNLRFGETRVFFEL